VCEAIAACIESMAQAHSTRVELGLQRNKTHIETKVDKKLRLRLLVGGTGKSRGSISGTAARRGLPCQSFGRVCQVCICYSNARRDHANVRHSAIMAKASIYLRRIFMTIWSSSGELRINQSYTSQRLVACHKPRLLPPTIVRGSAIRAAQPATPQRRTGQRTHRATSRCRW
jgi:hypothetical protein